MNRYNGKRIPPVADSLPTNERRHIGHIVHDDRGTAIVEWHDAPADYERQKFELDSAGGSSGRGDEKLRRGFDAPLELRNDDTFNPYDRKGNTFTGRFTAPVEKKPAAGKRDLRKLGEWIKQMREMEERKKNGGDGGPEGA